MLEGPFSDVVAQFVSSGFFRICESNVKSRTKKTVLSILKDVLTPILNGALF